MQPLTSETPVASLLGYALLSSSYKSIRLRFRLLLRQHRRFNCQLNPSQNSEDASNCSLIVLSSDAASQRFTGVDLPKQVRISLSIGLSFFFFFQNTPSVFEMVLKRSQRGLILRFRE